MTTRVLQGIPQMSASIFDSTRHENILLYLTEQIEEHKVPLDELILSMNAAILHSDDRVKSLTLRTVATYIHHNPSSFPTFSLILDKLLVIIRDLVSDSIISPEILTFACINCLVDLAESPDGSEWIRSHGLFDFILVGLEDRNLFNVISSSESLSRLLNSINCDKTYYTRAITFITPRLQHTGSLEFLLRAANLKHFQLIFTHDIVLISLI